MRGARLAQSVRAGGLCAFDSREFIRRAVCYVLEDSTLLWTQVSELQSAIRPKAPRSLSDRSIANLFLLPTFLLLVAMNIFPLVWSLYLSFCDYSGTSNRPAVWVGGAN